MAAARRSAKPLKRATDKELGVPEIPRESTPPETTNTVMLKTLMELKESMGKMNERLETLSEKIKGIETKQGNLETTINNAKTSLKTIGWFLTASVSVFGLYRYWPVLQEWLQLLRQH